MRSRAVPILLCAFIGAGCSLFALAQIFNPQPSQAEIIALIREMGQTSPDLSEDQLLAHLERSALKFEDISTESLRSAVHALAQELKPGCPTDHIAARWVSHVACLSRESEPSLVTVEELERIKKRGEADEERRDDLWAVQTLADILFDIPEGEEYNLSPPMLPQGGYYETTTLHLGHPYHFDSHGRLAIAESMIIVCGTGLPPDRPIWYFDLTATLGETCRAFA